MSHDVELSNQEARVEGSDSPFHGKAEEQSSHSRSPSRRTVQPVARVEVEQQRARQEDVGLTK